MTKGKAGKAIKITLLVLLALIILVGGGGFGYYLYIINSPQPQVDGSLQAKGLKDRVEIIRDANGTPHIYAKNMHDLYFAQGYAQAQDRWWQMEFLRKVCGGRLGELTGMKPATLNTDIFLRSLGFYRIAEKDYQSFSAENRAVFDALAEGVNAYIANRSPEQLSVNYTILGLTGMKFKVDPWSPLDGLAFAHMMAFDLGPARALEIPRATLYPKLGPVMAEQWLVPPWPFGRRATILQDEDVKSAYPMALNSGQPSGESIVDAVTQIYNDPLPDLSMVVEQTEGMGSNGWAATGSMTLGGKPLIANDAHLGIGQPSIYYEIHLHCSDDGTGRPFDVAGFNLVTGAGIVIGHNNDIAWAGTLTYPDVTDFHRMQVNAANSLQYEWKDGFRDMTSREETFRFGDGKPPVTVKVRETHLGPIINDSKYDAKTGEMTGFNNENPLALRWTGLDLSTVALASIGMNKAKNWDEFQTALKLWDIASQSITYADRQGNIGYRMTGKIPIRSKVNSGQVPIPGWTDEYEWKGYIPFELMPSIYNPARNYIVASNQEVAPPEYYAMLDKQLGPDVNANFGSKYNKWVYGYRSDRAIELLKQLAPNTVATYQTVQGDAKSIPASEILPALADLRFSDPELTAARDWLLKWDYVCSEDSAQAALFNEFITRLMQNTFQNKLEGIAKSDGVDKELWLITALLQKPDDPWWDDPATKDKKENRDEILTRSFQEGYAATVTALGKDKSQWKWGSLHKAIFVSSPLGASGIGPIESMVNQGPVTISGSNECINNTHWYASKGNFNAGMIPCMRFIIDLGDFDKSLIVNSTGVSGHPGSQWYGDQIVPWAKIKYHPMLWSRNAVEASTAHKLYLNP